MRTAQSQHPNVYKYYKFPLDEMRIDVVRCEPHTLSLRPFKFFFIDFYSYEVVSSSDTRKNKA